MGRCWSLPPMALCDTDRWERQGSGVAQAQAPQLHFPAAWGGLATVHAGSLGLTRCQWSRSRPHRLWGKTEVKAKAEEPGLEGPPSLPGPPPTPELIGMWGNPSSRPPLCCWWRPGQAPHLVMLCCSFFHCEEEMVVVPSPPGVGWCSPPLLPAKGVTQEGAPLSSRVEM